MLGQNARKTIDRQARRIPPGSRRNGRLAGIRSESAPRRSERDWGDGQDDDDDPDSVLGVQVSIVDAMRSILASGVASGHGYAMSGSAGGGGMSGSGGSGASRGGGSAGGGPRGSAEGGASDDEDSGADPTLKNVDDTSGNSRGSYIDPEGRPAPKASEVGETGGGSATDVGGIGGSGGGSAMGGRGSSST
jgi:hypothetical protein